MLEQNYYEEEQVKVIGACSCCGCDITLESDHYEFGNEYVCDDCKFVYLEDHIVYGEEN